LPCHFAQKFPIKKDRCAFPSHPIREDAKVITELPGEGSADKVW